MAFYDELDPALPVGSGGAGDGNEELQAIKAALQQQWPNLTGGTGDTGCTPSTDEINGMTGYDAGKGQVETRLTTLEGASGGTGTFPVGGIVMWSGSEGTVPAGWAICDGRTQNSITTPDLTDRFIVAAGVDANPLRWYAPGDADARKDDGTRIAHYVELTEGSGLHQHGGATQPHKLTINQMPTHAHSVTAAFAVANTTQSGGTLQTAGNGNLVTSLTGGNQAHSHDIAESGLHNHTYAYEPLHYAMLYIMYVGVAP